MSAQQYFSISLPTLPNAPPDTREFEFPEQPVTINTNSVSLRTIVRQYCAMPQSKSIPAKRLHMILGRLRCLDFIIQQYNEGIHTQSAVFLQYWRRRALDQLSGFGYQLRDPGQPILIGGLQELIAAIEELFKLEIESSRHLIASGFISFEGLAELYRTPAVPIRAQTGLGGHYAICLLTDCYYDEHRSLMGTEKSFHWSMDLIACLGQHYAVIGFSETLSGWTGVRSRPLQDLLYLPITLPADRQSYQHRGERYCKLSADQAQFVAYAPNSFFLHGTGSSGASSLSRSGSNLLPTGGRVMIDCARGTLLGHHASQSMDEPTQAMIQFVGRYRRWLNSQLASSSQDSSRPAGDSLVVWETVPAELMMFCWPALVGFSFTAKAWGHVLVEGLSEIQFHDHAFDRLVISEERKQLLRALIRFGGAEKIAADGDIVGSKNGGTIILLHGPPGVGKTVTAEAIAEVLHRPLYYVTMGELGVNPGDLERRLADVLDLCAGWNALALLDEADVFLETRSTNDLVRNTLVCVMLRLLEYHPGILFLTTNRVRSFDPAVESRVTVALRYDSLSAGARGKIWQNLLASAPLPVAQDVSVEELSGHALNGRQIKNAVRLAVALARERQTNINRSVLNATIEITALGRQAMQADDSWKE